MGVKQKATQFVMCDFNEIKKETDGTAQYSFFSGRNVELANSLIALNWVLESYEAWITNDGDSKSSLFNGMNEKEALTALRNSILLEQANVGSTEYNENIKTLVDNVMKSLIDLNYVMDSYKINREDILNENVNDKEKR